MQIDYIINESPGKGLGIFTNQFIPKNTLIWDFNKANINIYNEHNAKKQLYTSNNILEFLKYSYFLNNIFIDIQNDDGKYFNHSNNPNIILGYKLDYNFNPYSSYAIRDIHIGEELFDDYNTYDNEPEWYKELIELHNIDFSFMI